MVGFIWNIVLTMMIVYFILTIVQDIARREYATLNSSFSNKEKCE